MFHLINKTKNLTVFVLTIVICYVVYRAYSLSLTHDEALSYQIINGDEGLANTANHHYLNSWLMAFFTFLFGDKEIILRLPNVLSFLIYTAVCFKFLKGANFKLAIGIAIPILFFNHYLLDFFSLARGYGLSIGLLFLSLWYLLKQKLAEQFSKQFLVNALLCMLFASMALLANFNLINCFLAICAIFLFEFFYCLVKRKIEPKHVLYFVIASLVYCCLLYFVLKRLFFLKDNQQLYYGADTLQDGINTLIYDTFDLRKFPSWFTPTTFYLILALPIISLVEACINKKFQENYFKLALIIVLIHLGSVIQHSLFGTLYMLNRTGLYFIPLFGLYFYFFCLRIYEAFAPKLKMTFSVVMLLFIMLPLLYNFYNKWDPHFVSEWHYDANTKKTMQIIEQNNEAKLKVKLLHNWLFGPTIRYYIQSKKLNIEAIKLEGNIPENIDFAYLMQDDTIHINWKQIQFFEPTGSIIFKTK